MKKILGITLSMTISLMAEVITMTPYGGVIKYDSDYAKSYKDKASLGGLHTTIGNLNYLVEFDYAHLQTQYKSYNPALADLKQDDISLIYGHYYTTMMYRIGVHYINTTDVQLNNGVAVVTTLGGYKWIGYNKLSYGSHGYLSYYKNGHDENYVAKSITIGQLTPYISYYAPFSYVSSNTFSISVHYQYAPSYLTKEYISFEVSDSLYYKGYFLTLRGYNGKMRSGIKDGGITVFNTLDMMRYGGDMKAGYYFSTSFSANVSYGLNNYKEYGMDEYGTNKVALISMSYSF